MAFVVITQFVGDLKGRPVEHAGSSTHYPLVCKEYSSREVAQNLHPGEYVYTTEEYNELKSEMNESHGTILKPIPPRDIPAPVRVGVLLNPPGRPWWKRLLQALKLWGKS